MQKNPHQKLFTLTVTVRVAQWKSKISLDIWHFMRCLALGCNTKSHPLHMCSWDISLNVYFNGATKMKNCSSMSTKTEWSKQPQRWRCDSTHHQKRARQPLLQKNLWCRGNDTADLPPAWGISRRSGKWHTWRITSGCWPNLGYLWVSKHIKCIQDPEGIELDVKTGVRSQQVPARRRWRLCEWANRSNHCFCTCCASKKDKRYWFSWCVL